MYGYIEKCGEKFVAKQVTRKDDIPEESIKCGFWDVLYDKKGHSQKMLDDFIEFFGLELNENADFIVNAYFSSNCSFVVNKNSGYVTQYPQDFVCINGVNFNIHF